MEPTEDLVVPVSDHDSAQREAHGEESEWLQTIEVAQGFLRKEELDYRKMKRIPKYLFGKSLTTKTQSFVAFSDRAQPATLALKTVNRAVWTADIVPPYRA
jgi:hypothetical protein